MARKTYYQVHVVMMKVVRDTDNEVCEADILFETEPYGVDGDFETYDEAYKTFYKLTSET